MAWYYGKFSCGHEGRTNIIGSEKVREWKKKRAFSGLCPECYKRKLEEVRKKANIQAAKKSAEMELPELTGTEKQIAWANTLRLKVFEKYETYLEKEEKFFIYNKEEEKVQTSKEEMSDSLDYALLAHTDAKFWINSRFLNECEILADFIEEYNRNKKENDIPDDIKQEELDLKKSLIVVPESETLKSGVVEIQYKKDTLYVKYFKDDDFIKIVKRLNYKWEGCWCKKITEYTGTAENRSAELGNLLLTKGFTVQFPNIESKEKAIFADFEPENDRWVKYNSKFSELSISWTRRSDTLYVNAMKLPGAKWNNGSIKVRIEFYKEVEDFAETMGFSVSSKAKKEIEKYKQKESQFERKNVFLKNEKKMSDEERIEKSLKLNGTIIKDLIDE